MCIVALRSVGAGRASSGGVLKHPFVLLEEMCWKDLQGRTVRLRRGSSVIVGPHSSLP